MDWRKKTHTLAHVSFCLVFDEKNVLTEWGNIFENIEGCAKQYQCVTALHFISVFFAKKNALVGQLEHLAMANI